MTRPLTRQQVLTWRENWSFTDRALIDHALDLLPEHDYYEPSAAQYVAARVAGRVAVYVAPGYLYWPKATWCIDLDARLIPAGLESDDSGSWYALSIFMKRGESASRFEELSTPCPTCFMVPSVSGDCDCA